MVSYEIGARKRRATKAALHGSDESLLETAAQYVQCCIGAPRRRARKARGAPRTRRTQGRSNEAPEDESALSQYWWRRWESKPRPEARPRVVLQALPALKFRLRRV